MDADEAVAVVRSLESAGIRYVVSGGWGIDALLGRQTRHHADIDIGVDVARLEDALGVLGERGYRLTLDQRPARLELRAPRRRTVDLHPITWDAAGNGRQRGLGDEAFDYPAGAIADGRIAGEPVTCISAALQRNFHSTGALRPRDRADLRALDELGSANS